MFALSGVVPTISFALGATIPPGKTYPASWVNQLLIDLGFDPGGVSAWGEKSRAALKAAAQKFSLSYYSSTNRYEDPPGSGNWKSYGTGLVMVRPETLIPALEKKRTPKAAPTTTPAAAASARAGTAAPAATTPTARAGMDLPAGRQTPESPYKPPPEETRADKPKADKKKKEKAKTKPPEQKDLPPIHDLEKEIRSLTAKVKALRAALKNAEADLAACQKKKGKEKGKKQTAIATSKTPILAGKDNTWLWLAITYLAARRR